MERTRVSWSNDVDQIKGPCVVCGKEVVFVMPSSRSNPSLLYHATCDMMPQIRENLKKASPPPLPENYLVKKTVSAVVAPAARPAAAPSTAPIPPAAAPPDSSEQK